MNLSGYTPEIKSLNPATAIYSGTIKNCGINWKNTNATKINKRGECMTFEQVSEEAAEILSRLDKEKISPEDQLVVLWQPSCFGNPRPSGLGGCQ
jgi:hypothetical protein